MAEGHGGSSHDNAEKPHTGGHGGGAEEAFEGMVEDFADNLAGKALLENSQKPFTALVETIANPATGEIEGVSSHSAAPSGH